MNNSITLTSTVVATPDQVSANVADEGVILNLKDGVYYGLDPVGARIWSLIQEPKKVSEVRDTIVREYDVETVRCESDLLALLEDLAAKRLIDVRGGQPEKAA